MPAKKKEKARLHPRNKHQERYDFEQLILSLPALSPFVKMNIYGNESIDFSNAEAVKMLNTAILKNQYQIDFWEIPEGYLCPPIPGRADYIHHIADLLTSQNFGKTPKAEQVKLLDIGVGANCIYPIIGISEYLWSFIGSDIDEKALEAAKKIGNQNPILQTKLEFRLQKNPKDIFYGILQDDEKIDVSICNPPFHASAGEAQAGTLRKLSNLSGREITKADLNFGGLNHELWCPGGEEKFISNMIRQSKKFSHHIFWFSTLVSKQSHLKGIYEALKKVEVIEVKTIPMGQGNKSSRIVAWTFFAKEEKLEWVKTRWS